MLIYLLNYHKSTICTFVSNIHHRNLWISVIDCILERFAEEKKMKIEINKLVKQNVFHEDFCNLEDNNVLDFGNKNIVVIYGPNGTGKTSFSNVLRKEKGTQYEISYRGNRYTSKDDLIVHTISDQNGRNIIEGETQDFILGDNIKREYELKTKIEESYLSLFKKTLPSILKKRL